MEILTRAIANEYRDRALLLPSNGLQDIGELTDDEVKELDVALAISLGMKCRPGQADADTLERLNNLQMELERTKTELKEAKSGPDYKMMYDQLIEKMLSRR